MPPVADPHSWPARRHVANAPISLAAALTLMLPGGGQIALAGEPRFDASLNAEFTLTDNARLSNSNEKTDLILRLMPSLRAGAEGGRVKWHVGYQPNLVFYLANGDQNSAQNNLNATALFEAVDNFFFIESRAAVRQAFENPFLPTPGDATLATGNRVETYTLGLSPYIQGQLFGDYRYLLRNDNYYSNAQSNVSGDVLTSRVFGSIDSPVRRRLFWGADASYDYTKFENQQAFEAQLVRGRGGIVVTPELSVTGSGGYEQNDYGLTDYSGAIYGAGFDWRPTPRTRFAANWEERFFGPSYQVNFNHRTRLTTWSLNGYRNTQTANNILLALSPGETRESLDSILTARIPDPLVREAAIDQFMMETGLPELLGVPLGFYNKNIFLVERVDARVGILGARNSLHFRAYWEESETLTADDETVATDLFARNVRFRTYGGGAAYSHELAPRTNLTLSLDRSYTRSLTEQLALITGRDATQTIARVSVTHQLTPKTTVTGRVRVARYDSDQGGRDYDEHAIQALIFHRF